MHRIQESLDLDLFVDGGSDSMGELLDLDCHFVDRSSSSIPCL